MRPPSPVWLAVLLALLCAAPLARGGEDRKEIQVLFDFEDPADLEVLKKSAENAEFDIVQDNGVTSGKNCCRVVGKAGTPWASFEIAGEKAKDWGRYDYFALDLFTERSEKIAFNFELWDQDSKNYSTRCTYDAQTHAGRNTLLWKINRAKRNNKEGLEWRELQPKDKIQMNALKMVKLFFVPLKTGGDTVLWLDRFRLLQEDAVGGRIEVELPLGAKAYDFGPQGSATPGWTWIGQAGPGVSGEGVTEAGKTWPDPLTGGGLESAKGPFQFDAEVPDGEYWVWLSAGKVLNEKARDLPFLLQVGAEKLCDEKLSAEDFYGEKGLYRHLRTQFSQRPNALWLDYVLPVCPEQTLKAKAEGGKLTVRVSNHRLAALVLVPAADEAAFQKLAGALRAQRLKYFFAALFFDPHPAPQKQAGDGAYALWTPGAAEAVRPWSSPKQEQRVKALDLKAAPGQRVVARLCVTAFEDLGTGDLEIGDLRGPDILPAASIRRYYQNYRVAGTAVDEMALLPWTQIRFEPGLSWAYWLWFQIPAGAKPGVYRGSVAFKPEQGGARTLPLELEVYPFKLEERLPVSYGMYYSPWNFPEGCDRRRLLLEQHAFMREAGFTATCVGAGSVNSLKGNGQVDVKFDPLPFEIAKAAGMGRRPEQYQMGNTLGMARQIARKLGLSPAVDQNPGVEFTKPELKGYYQDAVKQYLAFIAQQGLPVALESVDEPREVPNPWNRNLLQTNTYADWIHEAGGKCFVTPMGDLQSGKDYTSLVEHHDFISVHAYEGSRKLIEKTKAAEKTLWFYNTGKDRLSWGFYNWRMDSKGRWEWHWSSDGGASTDGYPVEEGYTPFTGCAELAMRAPCARYPGGFLFKSAFLNIAEGIADYAYLVTLETALEAAKADAAKAKTVAEAREFLAALRKSIPEFPGIKGLASADAGALVGAGLETPVAELTESWRRKLAGYLAALK